MAHTYPQWQNLVLTKLKALYQVRLSFEARILSFTALINFSCVQLLFIFINLLIVDCVVTVVYLYKFINCRLCSSVRQVPLLLMRLVTVQ